MDLVQERMQDVHVGQVAAHEPPHNLGIGVELAKLVEATNRLMRRIGKRGRQPGAPVGRGRRADLIPAIGAGPTGCHRPRRTAVTPVAAKRRGTLTKCLESDLTSA